jgi:hypothetical protein
VIGLPVSHDYPEDAIQDLVVVFIGKASVEGVLRVPTVNVSGKNRDREDFRPIHPHQLNDCFAGCFKEFLLH